MTSDEALVMHIGDPIFIYDPGLRDVYEAKMTGIQVANVNFKGSTKGMIPSITGWCKQMKFRTYAPKEIHGTAAGALKAQSNHLQFEADRLLNKKDKVDQKLRKSEREE